MDTNRYEIIIIPVAIREINRIYEYISKDLYAERAAEKLMKQVEVEIQRLEYAPRSNIKIEKTDDLHRKYRRIVIKNYVILYTIDDYNRIVYVSHMYYGRRDYLNY